MSTQKQSVVLRAGLEPGILRRVNEQVARYRKEIASADITDKMASRALEHQLALWKEEVPGNEKALEFCLFELLTEFAVRFVKRNSRPVVCNELMELMPRISERIAVLYLYMDPQFKAPTRFGNSVPVEGMPSGSQAAVYRVRDSTGKLRVAKAAIRETPEANALRQEKAILTTLDEIPAENPARFARAIDYGRTSRSVYLIIEHIEGTTLEKIVSNRTLPTPFVAEIALQVATTLCEVHNRAILHLDVSPRNIIVSNPLTAPVATLIDFGTAAELDVANRTIANPSGIGKGTPGYASPEVASGQSCSVRSDVYSLAAVCMSALTDVIPSQEEEIQQFLKGANFRTRRFFAILRKATSKSSKERHEDAREFLNAIKPYAISTIKTRRRRSIQVAASAVAVCALLLLLIMALRQSIDPAQTRAPSVRTWIDDAADEVGFSLDKIRRDSFRVSADFKATALGNLPDSGFIYAHYDEDLKPFSRGLEGRLGDGPWEQMGDYEGSKVFTVEGPEIADNQEFSIRLDSVPGPVEGVVVAGPYTYSVDLKSIERGQLAELRASAATIDKSGLSGEEMIIHADKWMPGSFLIQAAEEIGKIELFENRAGLNVRHVIFDPDRDVKKNSQGIAEPRADALYRIFRELPKFISMKPALFASVDVFRQGKYGSVGVMASRRDNLYANLNQSRRNEIAKRLFTNNQANQSSELKWSKSFLDEDSFLIESIDVWTWPIPDTPDLKIKVHAFFFQALKQNLGEVNDPSTIIDSLVDLSRFENRDIYIQVRFLNGTHSDYFLRRSPAPTSQYQQFPDWAPPVVNQKEDLFMRLQKR